MKDTFGMALLDYFDDPNSVHSTERDDGHTGVIQTSFYFADFQEWRPVEQEITKLAKGRILDIGCGSGRSVKYFQEKGLKAVGIDISPLAIEASKKYGVKNCFVMDAMALDFPDDSFDSVMLLGNGLGLCGYQDGEKMLKELNRVAKPNGLLFASSRDPSMTNAPIHLAYHERNRKQGKPIGLVNLRVNFSGIKGDWFEFYMLEPKEVEDYICGTGWSLERIIESDDPIYGVILKNKG